MPAGGVIPTEEGEPQEVHLNFVTPEKLAEYDRLIAQGGIDALIEALKLQTQEE